MNNTPINDGGPAFPDNSLEHSSDMRGGMSFRAYAAAKIMAAMYASLDPQNMSMVASGNNAAMAEWAVHGADALIAALANDKFRDAGGQRPASSGDTHPHSL
jgi:hypothetical protein